MNRREFLQWCAAVTAVAAGPKLLRADIREDVPSGEVEIGEFSQPSVGYVNEFHSAYLRIGLDVGMEEGVFTVPVRVTDVLMIQPPATLLDTGREQHALSPFYGKCSIPADDHILRAMHEAAHDYEGGSRTSVLHQRMSWLLTNVMVTPGEPLGYDVIVDGIQGTFLTERTNSAPYRSCPWITISPLSPQKMESYDPPTVRLVPRGSADINELGFWRAGKVEDHNTIYYSYRPELQQFQQVMLDGVPGRSREFRTSSIEWGTRSPHIHVVNSWGVWPLTREKPIDCVGKYFPVHDFPRRDYSLL